MPVILEIKMSLVNIKKIFGSFNICIIYLHVIETCLNVTIVMFYFYHSKNPSNIMKNVSNSISTYSWKNAFLVKIYPSEHSSWWRCLEDVVKTSSRRLQNVLTKTNIFASLIRLTLLIGLEDVLKTSCKDVSKTFSRLIIGNIITVLGNTTSRLLRDVFKTFQSRTAKTVIYKRFA